LCEKYGSFCSQHALAKEIIATQVSNEIVSTMGITFAHRVQEETNASITDIVKAYIVVSNILQLKDIMQEIDSLDYKIDVTVQYEMLSEAVRIARRCILWFLRNRKQGIDIKKSIEQFAEPVGILFARISKLVLGHDKYDVEEKMASLVAKGVPATVAEKIANARAIYHAFNIIEATAQTKYDLHKVAKVYFLLVDRLDMLWFREQLNNYPINSHWSVLAKAGLKADLDWAQRQLTILILTTKSKAESSIGMVNAWCEKHQVLLNRYMSIINSFRKTENKDFELISVVVRELTELVRAASIK